MNDLEILLERMSRNIQDKRNYGLIGDYVALYLLRLQVKSRNVER
jgi:hypothetical protein